MAVPVTSVRSVAAPGPVAAIPGRDHRLAGARLVAGEVVAVADLGPVLGTPSDEPAASRWVVVIEGQAAPLGVLADRVSNTEIEVIDTTVTSSAPAPGGLVAGVTADRVLLLDVDALLADARFTAAPTPGDGEPSRQPQTKGSS